MARRLSLFLLLSSFCLALLIIAPAAEAAPSGSCSNSLYQPSGQSFWVGYPSPSNSDGPVVVFVHGYSSSHSTWTGGNYAVRDACNQGFRVAAVDLGAASSIWDNAAMLRSQLQSIAEYFSVSRVSVMAHSKGGIDTQTAIVHYGAYPYVQSYVAFATPFGGTDLADHACSWYGIWIWQCNDATWTLRTGYMSFVRAVTDGRAENDAVNAYAARGTRCDWYNPACALIAGPDDGVVPTWSVWASAVDTHIADRPLRHSEVHQTQRYDTTWLFAFLDGAPLAEPLVGIERGEAPRVAASAYTLRGGPLVATVAESVAVEGGLKAVTFSLLATADARVTVVSPSGDRTVVDGQRTEADALLQGIRYDLRVEGPEAGPWRVEAAPAAASARTGYLLRVGYEGGTTVTLHHDPQALYRPGASLALDVTASGDATILSASATLRDAEQRVVASADGLRASLALPAQPGTYDVALRVTGLAADGSDFERTLVTSLAAVDPAAVKEPASLR